MARTTCYEKTDVKAVLITAVLVLLCVLRHVPESHCKSVLISGSLSSDIAANRTDSDEQISKRKTPDRSIVQNDLMLVTIMAENSPAEKDQVTFWVDRTIVAMTVTVRNRGRRTCLLVDHFGAKPEPTLSSRRTTVWMVDRPTVGRWQVLQEGEGDYEVKVQGSSTVDVEVTMYDVNIHTGLAVLVHNSPTAGHQIRAIIDVIGTDAIKTIYNMSLMTSEGVELATHWLRAAGDPHDPQYSSTFTWPTQAVYIRVYGEEEKGTVFERQTSFIISPILIDLRLQGGVSSVVIGPEGSLMVSYQLINQGPSDSFQLSAESDNDVMTAEVSPALVRLGQQDSMLGRVVVTVPRYSAPTSGLLTVRVWSVSDPDKAQSASLLLTFPHTLPDLDPPTCQTLALTGDCSPQDVTSSTCHLRHWRVQVAVEDDVSGVKNVTFADVTKSDSIYVPPFEKGVTNQPVVAFFRATCCKAIILLDTSDTAGNERRCRYFQAEIPPLAPSSTPSPETRMSTSPPPLSTESAGHVTSRMTFSQGSGNSGVEHTTEMSIGQWRSSEAVTVDVTPSAIHFNETLARSNAVTHARGDKKHKGDSSTLKTASIILGSIGGCAGLLIAIICLLLFWRHRRLLRQRRHSCDSQDSSSSSDSNSTHHRHGNNSHHHHHGNNSREYSSHHHIPGNVSGNTYRHYGNSSSNNDSHHGNNSHGHHSNVIDNLHRHHGNSNHSHRDYGNSDNNSHRWRNADEHQRRWNNDSLHHHHSNTNDSSHRHHSHHSNGAADGSSSRQSTDGHRPAMPDVLQGSSPVIEFSTAL